MSAGDVEALRLAIADPGATTPRNPGEFLTDWIIRAVLASDWLAADRARVRAETLAEVEPAIDAAHLARQREWSERTFGPGARLRGVLAHIRKELKEIEAAPTDVEEWVDVLILAFDGAWRAGWEPQQIIDAIKTKQAKNEAREWPDWRTMSPDEAIEHVRDMAEAGEPDA